jgi:hypothetical protein
VSKRISSAACLPRIRCTGTPMTSACPFRSEFQTAGKSAPFSLAALHLRNSWLAVSLTQAPEPNDFSYERGRAEHLIQIKTV